MTSSLHVEVLEWLDTSGTGSLRIAVGGPSGQECFTKVYDHLARTERDFIRVPVVEVAEWWLVNWWRLRFEPAKSPTPDWRAAHVLAAIGGGTPWPALEVTSDGLFVRLELAAEKRPEAAAVQYRGAVAELDAIDFERGLDRFFDSVAARERAMGRTSFPELLAELRAERADPDLAKALRRRAIAGREAPDPAWDARLRAFDDRYGDLAVEECLAAGEEDLDGSVARLRSSADVEIDTGFLELLGWRPVLGPGHTPWEVGERAAAFLRGSMPDWETQVVLGAETPRRGLRVWGGITDRGALKVTTRGGRTSSRRFEAARALGDALLGRGPLMPVTDAKTSTQKYQRAFAAELLCPWEALVEFTDRHGLDDDAIADAAEHFRVSERLVLSRLVNKHTVSRARLELPWEP